MDSGELRLNPVHYIQGEQYANLATKDGAYRISVTCGDINIGESSRLDSANLETLLQGSNLVAFMKEIKRKMLILTNEIKLTW